MNITVKPSRRRATIIQLIGSYGVIAISTVQGLVLIPLYIKYIGAELYGIWLASGGVLAWLGIMEMGIASLTEQRIANAYAKRDLENAGLYFLYGFYLYSMLSLLMVLCAWFLSSYIPTIFNAPKDTYEMLSTCFALAGVALSLSYIKTVAAAFPKALQRPMVVFVLENIRLIIQFTTTLYLILAGYGLWSIPFGQLAGIVPVTVGLTSYSFFLYLELGKPFRLKKSIFMDYLKISPALFFSKTGSQLISRIEPTLIALFINPEMATAFSVTKKAGEIFQGLLNRFAGAVFSGFAHLYGENNKEKAVHVFETCISYVFWIGTLYFATYIVFNGTFVTLWTGADQYLGQVVTTLIAVALLLQVLNNLVSYLLGATGDIAVPSLLKLVEAVTRLVFMLILLPVMGVAGLPLASATSVFIFGIVFYQRMTNRLPLTSIYEKFNKSLFIPCLLMIGIILMFSLFVQTDNWVSLLVKAGIFFFCGGIIIVWQMPLLKIQVMNKFPFLRKSIL